MPDVKATTSGWVDVDATAQEPAGWGASHHFDKSLEASIGQAASMVGSFNNSVPVRGRQTREDTRAMVISATELVLDGLKTVDAAPETYGKVDGEDVIKSHEIDSWKQRADVTLDSLRGIWRDMVGGPLPKGLVAKPKMQSVR